MERTEKILDLIKDIPTISRTDIARTLSLTEAQSRTAIDHLKNNNTIKWDGSPRKRKMDNK